MGGLLDVLFCIFRGRRRILVWEKMLRDEKIYGLKLKKVIIFSLQNTKIIMFFLQLLLDISSHVKKEVHDPLEKFCTNFKNLVPPLPREVFVEVAKCAVLFERFLEKFTKSGKVNYIYWK